MILQLLQRYGPTVLKTMGLGTPTGVGMGGDAISGAMNAGLNNPMLKAAMAKATAPQLGAAPAPAAPSPAPQPPMSPNARVAQGFDMFNPSASNGVPTMASQNLPTPMDNDPTPKPPQNAMAQAAPAVPMPQPRPDDAPQASPQMGFFQRNSAMMRDPSSGQFIDPANADIAQSQQPSGPDVIAKLMSYFHNKDQA